MIHRFAISYHMFFLIYLVFIRSMKIADQKSIKTEKSKPKEIEKYLAICACMRDEDDISEWVEYHRRMGVSKFYINDNNSSSPDGYLSLYPYIKTGLVEYYNVLKPHSQREIYKHCIHQYRHRHQFIGFIDIDEFIVVNETYAKSIPQILSLYKNHGGLTLNWKYFSSSGHLNRPKGGVIPNYWKCIEDNRVKSIVNTKYVLEEGSDVHHFHYESSHPAVDTNHRVVRGPLNPPSDNNTIPSSLFSVMFINHYVTKSWQDFQKKQERGGGAGAKRNKQYFRTIEDSCYKTCPLLQMPKMDLPAIP